MPTILRRSAESAVDTPELEPAPDLSVLEGRLTALPESATDPFASRRSRLKATLGLYRFSGVGASLLDWAASQTQLKDPLSCFSRHDLERLFDRFRIALDAHTRKLVHEARRQEPAVLAEVLAQASLAAQQAVRRVDAGR
ncbi:hypothetical protein J4558_23455 [Leptolyngbya sp. 15MV]|nr:hypothetical protein J4558_23455 [Leptolyngbya sp. 15MV]